MSTRMQVGQDITIRKEGDDCYSAWCGPHQIGSQMTGVSTVHAVARELAVIALVFTSEQVTQAAALAPATARETADEIRERWARENTELDALMKGAKP